MKNRLITLFTSALFVASAPAASIISTNFGNGLTLNDGTTALSSGSLRFGTFADGYDFNANAGNFAALDAAFTEVYTYSGAINAFSTNGFFQINQSYNNVTFDGTPFDSSSGATTNVGGDIAGEKVYLWVLDNTTPGSATQQAIFSSNITWTDFDTIGNNDTLFDPDSATSGLVAHIGSLSSGADIGAGAPSHSLAAVAPIPEPSRAMLGFIGFAAMLFRRRRA